MHASALGGCDIVAFGHLPPHTPHSGSGLSCTGTNMLGQTVDIDDGGVIHEHILFFLAACDVHHHYVAHGCCFISLPFTGHRDNALTRTHTSGVNRTLS